MTPPRTHRAAVALESKRALDVEYLLSHLERWVTEGEGLALPRSQRRALAAMAVEFRRMGKRLGIYRYGRVELVAGISVRRLSELAGISTHTVKRALRKLIEAELIEVAEEAHIERSQARQYRIAPALWRQALANVASLPQSTADSSSTSHFEGSDVSRELVGGWVQDATFLAADLFAHGQAGLDGIGESGLKVVLALGHGPSSPGELKRRTDLHRATIARVLKVMEDRGMILRTGNRITLDPAALKRECESTTRVDALRDAHREERAEFEKVREQMKAAKAGASLATRQRQRHAAGAVASAFAKPSASDPLEVPEVSESPPPTLAPAPIVPDAPLVAAATTTTTPEPSSPASLSLVSELPAAPEVPEVPDAEPDWLSRSIRPKAELEAITPAPLVADERADRPAVVPFVDLDKLEKAREVGKRLQSRAARTGARLGGVPRKTPRRPSSPPNCRHGDVLGACTRCKALRELLAEEASA